MTTSAFPQRGEIWTRLAEPLSRSDIKWRADGKVNDAGKVRFVPYTDAQVVARRFEAIVPGEWDVTCEVLPPVPNGSAVAVKTRVQVLGVIREGIGQGTDWKGAETDAFKRAAVRFGIGADLYDIGQVWVRVVDPNAKYPRAAEDPYDVWKGAPTTKMVSRPVSVARADAVVVAQPEPARFVPPADVVEAFDLDTEEPIPVVRLGQQSPDSAICPKCGGRTWDNRLTKRNPKAPDFKCRDRGCDGVIWPPKNGAPDPYLAATAPTEPAADDDDDPNGIPF